MNSNHSFHSSLGDLCLVANALRLYVCGVASHVQYAIRKKSRKDAIQGRKEKEKDHRKVWGAKRAIASGRSVSDRSKD